MENMKTEMNTILTDLGLKADCVEAFSRGNKNFYDIRLRKGERVRKVRSVAKEMSLSLRCKGDPIISLVPEKGLLRIKAVVDDAPLLDFNKLWNNSTAPEGILPFLIGETEFGEPLWMDMCKNPHLLVAGTTGSGKSTLLHVLIENALRRDDVDLYLVDPKHGVEFGVYEDDAIQLASEYDEAVFMLAELNVIMERRFKMLKKLGMRSIADQPDIFSKILVVIDEVADIMLKDKKNKDAFQKSLLALAAKARAVGICLVAATQRPSVNVLTGDIKANFPARISCRVNRDIDSRVILDEMGAENLIGKGDAILKNSKGINTNFQVAYFEPTN